MKRIGLIIMLCLALVLGAFTLGGCKPAAPEVNAKDTVTAALDAYKAGDFDKFASYFKGSEDVSISDFTQGLGADEATAKRLIEGLGKNMDYKILSGKEDDSAGKATAEVEITAIDISKMEKDLTDALTKKVMEDPSLAQKPQSELMNLVFDEMIKAFATTDAKKTDTVSVELSIEKKDGKSEWKIDNDTLIDPLFGYAISSQGSAAK